MSKIVILIYRCKLCNEQFDKNIGGFSWKTGMMYRKSAMESLDDLALHVIHHPDWSDELVYIHRCNPENEEVIGIAELIGVRSE